MRFLPLRTIILLTALSTFSGCVKPEDAGKNTKNNSNQPDASVNQNSSIAKDDVTELESIINLPLEADESSVWREIEVTAQGNTPAGKKLIAILRFTPENAIEVVKLAESHRAPVSAILEAESWYPPELIAQSGNSGDETIKGNSYAANDFVKTPYVGGKITRIVNTDYFVLELTTF